MSRQYENCLFPGEVVIKIIVSLLILPCSFAKGQEIGNYVSNGSFEDCFSPNMAGKIPYYWSALDSSKYYGGLMTPPNLVPSSSFTFQYPKDGNNYLITQFYSKFVSNNRGYPRNRLKKTLSQGKIYCVKIFVSLTNQSTHGIDAIGCYFGDGSLDTVVKCTDPITYLFPQIENASHNIITDTLNWVPITGTFVASGTEKYLLVGNFKNNSSTDTMLANPTNLPSKWAEYAIDAVSCIELDLPAYAGRDTTVTPGTPIFLGREPDFAIDPGCTWYQWPNISSPIYDKAGLWVNPVVTTTYVVKQVLDCSTEKWDTVVVTVDPSVGLLNHKLDDGPEIFPTPASEFIELRFKSVITSAAFHLSIYSGLGQSVREEDILVEKQKIKVNTADLKNGSYLIFLKDHDHAPVARKLLISK